MANGATTSANVEVVTQRVSALEAQFNGISRQIDAVANKFDSQMAALNERITAARTPQWQVILGFLTTMVIVGGALWTTGINPVKEDITDLKVDVRATIPRPESQAKWEEFQRAILKNADDVVALKEKSLTKAEYEATRLASRQDTANAAIKLDTRIQAIEDGLVSRGEHAARWASDDRARADIQRQIDEINKREGATYGVRDVILDLKERVERLDRIRGGAP